MSRSSSTTSTADGPQSMSRRQRIEAVGFRPAEWTQERVPACNLCGADRFCAITWTDRYGFDTQCNMCLACGLVFLSPRLTAAEYRRFYEGVYRPLVSAYHNRRIDAVTVQDDQRGYARDLLSFVAPLCRARGIRRLLDIGGSTGVVAEAVARELGCDGVVLDPAPQELARAEARGLSTICSLLEDYDPRAGGTFELVLLCQTVDHLLDVAGSLRKIRELLAGDGLFYVDFVDFRSIYLREGAVEEAVKIDHPYNLTRQTMDLYLAAAGFEVRAASFLPDGHHVGYLCGRSEPRRPRPDPAYVEGALEEIRSVQARSRR